MKNKRSISSPKTTFAEFSTDAIVGKRIYTDIPPNWKRIIRVEIDNIPVEFESRLRVVPPKLKLKKAPKKSGTLKVLVEQYVSELRK